MAGPQYRQPETTLSGVVPVRASPLEQQMQQANQLIQSLSVFLQVPQLTRHERREITGALERLSEAVQDGDQRRLRRAIGSAQELQADLTAKYGQRQFPGQPAPAVPRAPALQRSWEEPPPLQRNWEDGTGSPRPGDPGLFGRGAFDREVAERQAAMTDAQRALQQLRGSLQTTDAPLRMRSEIRRFIRHAERELEQATTTRLREITAQANQYDFSIVLRRQWAP